MANIRTPGKIKRKGFLLAGSGVLLLSTDAVLVKFAHASAQDAAFWRGIFIATSLPLFLLIAKRIHEFRDLVRFGYVAVAACFLYACNTALFVFSISHTEVANTVVLLCCTPIFSALFSRWTLQEHTSRHAVFTFLITSGGILLVFFGSLETGGLLGNLLALILAASTAVLLSLLRKYAGLPRIPAVAIGAFFSAVVLLPFSNPLSVPWQSLSWLALVGLLLKPVASVSILSATRYLPAAEVSLLLLVQAVLAPLWAWLLLAETLSTAGLAGAVIVLMSALIHVRHELRQAREPVTDSK